VVAVGALLVLGSRAAELAEAEGLALEQLALRQANLWEPDECPLCAAGVAVELPELRPPPHV
jgi:orotate phosphoribosyltransferase